MSAFKPPSGRASRSEVRTLSSASESNAMGTSQPKRQNSFSGRSRRLSNSGRETPVTGERNVNRIMGNLNLSIKTASAGRMGLLIGSAQSDLEALQNEAKDKVTKETKKLKNMESRGKTPLININKQKTRVKRAEKKLTEVESAIEQVMESKTPKRRRNNNTTVKPIKRTKSAEGVVTPSKFTNKPKPPSATRKPSPRKPSSRRFVVPKFTSQQIQPNVERRLVASQQARNMLTFLRNVASRKPRIDPVNNNNGRSKQTPVVPPAPPVPKSKVTKGGPPSTPPPPPKKNGKKPKPKPSRNNVIANLKRTLAARKRGKENVVETITKNNKSRNSMNGSKPSSSKPKPKAARALFSKQGESQNPPSTQPVTEPQNRRNASNTNSENVQSGTQTPPTYPQPTQAPPQTGKHRDAKRQGAEERAKERQKRWEEVPPAVKKALEPEFNRIAKQKNTPPGITKTNIERLLQPFKQPVSVKFAPTISVKGGSAKATTGDSSQQTQIQYKTKPKTPDNKKKKPLKLVRSPETMRKEKSAAFRKEILSKLRSPVAAKRREALYSLRTPTTGQRKKHVIELIDRVLRRMKVRKDVENKLIKFYESLSERHIKQLFGGRTREEVRSIIKKQVAYFSKKR